MKRSFLVSARRFINLLKNHKSWVNINFLINTHACSMSDDYAM